jgi:protein-L-isoaspartate(D-aspartate) O-methyltransferase
MAMPEHARRVSREGGDGIVRSRMANDLPRVTSIVVAVTLLARIAPCAAPGGGRPEAAGPEAARVRMVEEQIAARGIADPAVLRAMRTVPRHEFVPARARADAYADRPLPIGHGQTISQPYVVALMTELATVKPGDRVLEIGTGSGYQAAILCAIGAEVYTVEILEPLARAAEAVLRRLGYGRVHVRHGDGSRGWPEAAPFAAVVVTAAAPEVPAALVAQLAPGGRLVIPVGEGEQELRVLVRTPSGIETRASVPVQFVPLVVGP